jgi:hypothetical protein
VNLPVSLYAEPWDVNRRLAELGLKEDILQRAVQRGWLAFASCTLNHPRSIPGIWAWGETICSLGDQLVPAGWQRIDESMLPLIINRSGTIALSAASGNENTGNPKEDPLTSSSKGPRTMIAIFANRRQLVIPEVLSVAEMPEIQARSTWWLLAHRDIAAREIRAELSRPIRMDAEGRIDGWAERIILSSQQLDEIPEGLVGGGNGPQGPEITLEIRRRA